ncbi:MAG TPA: Tol-Pal system beta propeller repeat protein TolB, partial [Methylomirabilota bacterium]|nr:Tol-Pal system beta propeller repeat protein TolB [Methylomirabilota bacterium]
DSRRITYYSASVSRGIGQVCIVDVATGEIEVVVAEPPVYNVEPAWSRDGRYLAFRSIRGGNHDVYTWDLETASERRLTDDEAPDIEPGWSPDGEWIAFPSGRDNPFFDIFIMRKDGSDVRRVTDDPAKDSEPVWAP